MVWGTGQSLTAARSVATPFLLMTCPILHLLLKQVALLGLQLQSMLVEPEEHVFQVAHMTVKVGRKHNIIPIL